MVSDYGILWSLAQLIIFKAPPNHHSIKPPNNPNWSIAPGIAIHSNPIQSESLRILQQSSDSFLKTCYSILQKLKFLVLNTVA